MSIGRSGKINYLFDLHGFTPQHEMPDIVLGTGNHTTCSEATSSTMSAIFRDHGFDVEIDKVFTGGKTEGTIITTFRDAHVQGVEAIQIELSRNIRNPLVKPEDSLERLTQALIQIIRQLS